MNKEIETIIKRLKEGNKNFVYDALTKTSNDSIQRKAVINSQKPFAIVLTCSDSRVLPGKIFDAGIGELFIVRVAGNVANQASISSIEYAVAYLGVKVIIVLGHQNCGAITAALKNDTTSKNIEHLLKFIKPAILQTDSNEVDAVSELHTKLTVESLIKGSSIIADAVIRDELKIFPGFYSLETGEVKFEI
jgi:carbonic anhydrase